ncbi:MAG: Mut7-C RNAse domain-containing protein [Candidatus Bathyarchaeota archaeon]|nr:MAG: Mut7-C RNAse domain-containing protein [Candidatus Bathyarchaeota archaeon]
MLKILTDGMLGKFTRWLRMLGHDVKYDSNLDDEALIRIAKDEKRVLLTRDLQLQQQAIARSVNVFLVKGENEAERLAALSQRFQISLEFNPDNSRCPKCNTKIRPTKKEKVSKKIPPNTRKFYEDFWECVECGKVYWQGAHWKRIAETFKEARSILASG